MRNASDIEPAAEHPVRHGRILVIDDNRSILETLSYLLAAIGHSAKVTEDGEEGLKIAAEGEVDLILTDVDMPRIGGLAVCESIKSNPRLQHLPVVMMTGRPSRDLVERALAAGARAVVPKPFDLSLLEATLAENLIQ
jgi:chemosensory pili system protein ChpA (sensor histidine kinase/response regulator)